MDPFEKALSGRPNTASNPSSRSCIRPFLKRKTLCRWNEIVCTFAFDSWQGPQQLPNLGISAILSSVIELLISLRSASCTSEHFAAKVSVLSLIISKLVGIQVVGSLSDNAANVQKAAAALIRPICPWRIWHQFTGSHLSPFVEWKISSGVVNVMPSFTPQGLERWSDCPYFQATFHLLQKLQRNFTLKFHKPPPLKRWNW